MELGTKENPIYVDDDDEVRCEGCGEDGHILWDCTVKMRGKVGTTGYGRNVGMIGN